AQSGLPQDNNEIGVVPADKLGNVLAANVGCEQKWPVRPLTTFSQIFDCELRFGMYTWRTTVNKPQEPVQDLPQDLAEPSPRFRKRTSMAINPIDVTSGNLSLNPRELPKR